MRRNQISINISRYNSEVPKSYPADRQIIHVYSDSNNLFEALSMAYAQAINAIREWQHVAVRTDITTNANEEISGKMLGRRYEDELGMDYVKERLSLQKDLLFYIENAQEIIEIIKRSENKDSAKQSLIEKFGFSTKQATNLFRVRFDIFTQEEIADIKRDIEQIENCMHERKTSYKDEQQDG